MTTYDPQRRKDLPHGHAAIGLDDNGIEHRMSTAAHDDRVFLLDGDDVVETHDLGELADAGALTGTMHDGRWYAADTPRAWVAAWDRRIGWHRIDIAASVMDCMEV